MGVVATSHPVAVDAAVSVLRGGGNAVDAAVCAAAVLGVVDPMSTGVGGDCFALVWSAAERKLYGLNGSGRAARAASLEELRRRGHDTMPQDGIVTVTVPGAVHAWQTLLARFGRRSLGDALAPAVRVARDGFEVTPVVARDWALAEPKLARGHRTRAWLVSGERAPRAGERFAAPHLAASLERIAEDGPDAFYRGAIAADILATSRRLRGWLTEEDLAQHTSEWVEPISARYRGARVFQIPPNAQGLVVLEALAILEQLALAGDAAERTHLRIEAIKLAFVDGAATIAEPSSCVGLAERLLDPAHVARRVARIGPRAIESPAPDVARGDTVYIAVVDDDGNAVSLINSLYMHFGSAVVAGDTGIVLHNRGAVFSSDPAHPNALAGGHRPYHTTIPSMAFRGEEPWLVLGVVGGFQQPQGQVQVLSGILDDGLALDAAVDAPRFRWLDGKRVRLESGIPGEVVRALRRRGHEIVDDAAEFGFGAAQAVMIDPTTGELSGASDRRKDGCVGRT